MALLRFWSWLSIFAATHLGYVADLPTPVASAILEGVVMAKVPVGATVVARCTAMVYGRVTTAVAGLVTPAPKADCVVLMPHE